MSIDEKTQLFLDFMEREYEGTPEDWLEYQPIFDGGWSARNDFGVPDPDIAHWKEAYRRLRSHHATTIMWLVQLIRTYHDLKEHPGRLSDSWEDCSDDICRRIQTLIFEPEEDA